MGNTYKDSGVSIEAGDKTVDLIKGMAKSTFTPSVLSGIGMFGSFYQPDFTKYPTPVLVSSVDGVGTKLKVAFMMDVHTTVGQDIVNHCVDDIAVCGADPLYFLDYVAFGKLIPQKAADLISGMAKACKENNCSLVGGETAEMPGMYAEDEYDISGTIVGVVDKDSIINGSTIEAGNVLIGFKSNGLHTNGYSLARKVLFPKFKISDYMDDFGQTLGEELLRVHKSYLSLIQLLRATKKIRGFSHITGGGIVGNTKRILHGDLSLNVNWKSWEIPPLFQLIQSSGSIADEEMREVFNMGIGLIAIVAPEDVDSILTLASTVGETGVIMGTVV